MKRVSDYIAEFLVEKNVKDIFMLTGYGAMYMNDAIEQSGIQYYACRNEAAAPMMAESYARVKQDLGVVCVTAGPGATNAIPGLAEAWVDSAPILVLSGQVHQAHTTYHAKLPQFRSFGTAEIDIIPIVESITKFAAELESPNQIRYMLEKAYHCATTGRPGPVWLSVPIDIQSALVDFDSLEGFEPPEQTETTLAPEALVAVAERFHAAKKPLIICGHGVRQSGTVDALKQLIAQTQTPVFMSRLGQDVLPHDDAFVLGQAGMKGVKYTKQVLQETDFILSLGCRLAIPFIGEEMEYIPRDVDVAMVDIDAAELKKPGFPLKYAIHADLRDFMPAFNQVISTLGQPDRQVWLDYCHAQKQANPMVLPEQRRNPIDLYYFMSRIDALSCERHILTTDAGSNYYVGGQVYTFQKGQREITSGTFAAMGTSIPLAIGAAVASPDKQILAVTGDGSLELNIQELKTISHYGLNVKVFVINNGGYLSMLHWQDTYFDGRRIDEADSTGAGTLNLKNVATAFDMPYARIADVAQIDTQLEEIMAVDGPLFIEVMTDNNQKIVES